MSINRGDYSASNAAAGDADGFGSRSAISYQMKMHGWVTECGLRADALTKGLGLI